MRRPLELGEWLSLPLSLPLSLSLNLFAHCRRRKALGRVRGSLPSLLWVVQDHL
ncbi:hypothetical protein LY76DRAFT_590891 [Colletotrichum caudatum]|nr:hypothetical protein LY76DRAFT_590891 [Colletotrichum caudatum]